MSKILQTTNYSQFHLIDSNRKVRDNLVLKSIMEKDMLRNHPILVTPREHGGFYIIDGQHRWSAAKKLNYPIFYIISEDIGEEDIPRCQVQRPWDLLDFLRFHRGHKEEYEFIGKIHDEFPSYPLHFVVQAFSNMEKPFHSFRQGKFKLKKNKNFLLEKFYLFHEVIIAYNDISIDKKKMSLDGMCAVWRLINQEDYDQKKMLKKIYNNKDAIIESFTYKDIKNIYDKLHKLYWKHQVKKEAE